MANKYGQRSSERLNTTHPDIRTLMRAVVTEYPNTILQGVRTDEQQQKNVDKGVSKTLESKHLVRCSVSPMSGVDAVDAAPDPLAYPQLKDLLHIIERALGSQPLDDEARRRLVDAVEEYGKDVARWYMFGGYVLGTADQLHRDGRISKTITWGGDWDKDKKLKDQSFDDLGHFQRDV